MKRCRRVHATEVAANNRTDIVETKLTQTYCVHLGTEGRIHTVQSKNEKIFID